MTQEELANELGITNKTVSKWKTGRSFPDASLLEPLSKILSVSELLNGENSLSDQDSILIDLTKIIHQLKKQKQEIMYLIAGLILVNLGDRLSELVLLNRFNVQNEFVLGFVDGVSVA